MDNYSVCDSSSVTSTSSVSNSKVTCPFCNDTVNFRYLFGHFINTHKSELIDFVDIANIQEMVCRKEPFRVSTENGHKVLGCFGCKSAYSSDHKAKDHFRKKPECFASHLKEMALCVKQEVSIPKKVILDKKQRNELSYKFIIHSLRMWDYWLAKEIEGQGQICVTHENASDGLRELKAIVNGMKYEDINWTAKLNHIDKLISDCVFMEDCNMPWVKYDKHGIWSMTNKKVLETMKMSFDDFELLSQKAIETIINSVPIIKKWECDE